MSDEDLVAHVGWAGLCWAVLGWAGLGWAVLGRAEPCWAMLGLIVLMPRSECNVFSTSGFFSIDDKLCNSVAPSKCIALFLNHEYCDTIVQK